MERRVEVFFDGECPLCRREIAMLRRLDRRGAIRFTDIAEPGFDPAVVGPDLDHATLMARIHGRRANGELIEGVEVFRELYAAVGFRRLVAMSRWPGIRNLAELGYRIFAKNRLRLPFRTKHDCATGACGLSPEGVALRPTGEARMGPHLPVLGPEPKTIPWCSRNRDR